MSQFKHQLFQVHLESNTADPSQDALKHINSFLDNPNYLYVNHSISVAEAKNQSGKVIHYILLVSMIYKDLSIIYGDLKKVSKKSLVKIKNSEEREENLPQPVIQTGFDKKTQKAP